MPSPAKRQQRPRRESARKSLVSERPESSSPSRPAKRRKTEESPPPQDIVDEDDSSSLLPEDSTNDSLVDLTDLAQLVPKISPFLAAPVVDKNNHPPYASLHYSNDNVTEDAGHECYSQIVGRDWTFFVHRTSVNIGRSNDGPNDSDDSDDEGYIHVDLGPSKLVSRHHATIHYESDGQGRWYLKVEGRNGVKVNGHLWRSGTDQPLSSGNVLEIGGNEMIYFLPPDIPFTIHPTYLMRAKLPVKDPYGIGDQLVAAADESSSSQDVGAGGTAAAVAAAAASQARLAPGYSFQQPIAPAPPGHRRPGTPPSAAKTTARLSPQATNSDKAALVHGLDLSLDENHNHKPQYSYAQMITQAIMSTKDEKLNLNGIYTFITTNFAYYRHQETAGWQNSIRHNLSLNKAFEKVARSVDEPGKGMKWQLVSDTRDEMLRNAHKLGRGGHRGSSNPSSPSQLNYITQGPKDMATKGGPGSARKRRVSPTGSPQPRSSLRNAHMTPDRSSRHVDSEDAAGPGDGSPLPRQRNINVVAEATMSETAPRSPVVLTSSYGQDEFGGSFVTPAPHRMHPRLAPPSTAQRPSQYLPTSSPAPFWKYADIDQTPIRSTPLNQSPSKNLDTRPQSSSPPRLSRSPAGSPAKNGKAETQETIRNEDDEDDIAIDLTQEFMSIGEYHAAKVLEAKGSNKS